MKEFKEFLDKSTNGIYKWLNKISEKITSGKYSVAIKTIIRIVLLIIIYWLIGILFNAFKYLGIVLIYLIGVSGRNIISTFWTITVELTYALFVIVTLYRLIIDYKKSSKDKLIFKNKKKDDEVKEKFFSGTITFVKILSFVILIPLFIIDIGSIYIFGLLFGFLNKGIQLVSLFTLVFGIIIFITSLIFLIKILLSEKEDVPKKYFNLIIVSITIIALSGVLFVFETNNYQRVDTLTEDFKTTTIRQQYKLDSKKKYIINNNGGLRKINVVVDDDLGSYMEVKIVHYTTNSIKTTVREGNKETTISFNQNLNIELGDLEKLYNLTTTSLKEKKMYNYNLLKYGDIEVRVSSEYKNNIKIVNRVKNDNNK